MNLLILNGQYPQHDQSRPYRGTYRVHPTYCDALPESHEVNQLFMWFLEEGGQTGVVHDLPKAIRFAELCNLHCNGQRFEVIEAIAGIGDEHGGDQFLGYDLSMEYGYSLVWCGLEKIGLLASERVPAVQVFSELIADAFRPRLNRHGLFDDCSTAMQCLRAMASLQELCPGVYECGDFGFEVVGLRMAASPDKVS